MSASNRDRETVERGWQAFVDGEAPKDVRAEVLGSWHRSAANVPVGIDQAPVIDDAAERWQATPVALAFRAIEEELRSVAVAGDFVAAVTDSGGTIVWSVGGRTMRRKAERVAFAPGGRWDEAAVGTNALAMALRDNRPATVWSAEHYASSLHDWVCYSAPIHDPMTQLPCGVIDLSTTWRRATPLALSTVTALARLLDHALAGTAPGGLMAGAGLQVNALGRGEVRIGGVTVTLAPRQIELLTVLTLFPDGLTLEQLHERLHGDRAVQPSTTKAEISHLRQVLGGHLLNRPYRLAPPLSADHLDVVTALRRGEVDRAVRAYRGRLLPMSESPTITDHRHVLDVAVRRAVLDAADPELTAALAEVMPDDDLVQERCAAQLPARDPRRALALGRLDGLRR